MDRMTFFEVQVNTPPYKIVVVECERFLILYEFHMISESSDNLNHWNAFYFCKHQCRCKSNSIGVA